MDNKELCVKETILGVLKSRDTDGKKMIHCSDFRMALSELGFQMGSRVVEDILVLCKVFPEGQLSFAPLEEELVRQRRIVNSTSPMANRPPTSAGAQPKPWRADLVHNHQLSAETQAKLVQEHRTEIFDAFQRYSRGTMNSDQLKNFISSLGISLTREFSSQMRQNCTGDITFAALIRSLVHFDSNAERELDPGFGAGGSGGFSQTESPTNRKRVDWNKCRGQLENPASAVVKPGRKPAANSVALRSSEGIMNTVFTSVQNPSKRTGEFATVSQLQQASAQGELAEVRYSSELKVIREQVLAALRKLAASELAIPEFQKIVFNMGIELPEVVVTLLDRSLHTGHLEMNKVIQLLDGAVFKVMAQEAVVPLESLRESKMKFVSKLRSNYTGSLAGLSRMFNEADRDGNGVLSFSEFKQMCSNFGLLRGPDSVTEEQLRILFLEYDTDGSGSIDFAEFKNSIRGELSAKRRNLVQLAFKKIDRQGTGTVLWEAFVDCFDARYHPDVKTGIQTREQVLDDWRAYCMRKGYQQVTVTYEVFVDIFSDLSSMMASDAEFEEMVVKSFALNPNFAPPVPDYTIHAAGSNLSNRTPMARQVHGDCVAWSQEESSLERSENEKRAVPLRRPGSYARNASSDVLWPTAEIDHNKAMDDEFSIAGSSKMSKDHAQRRNSSNVTAFTWNIENKRNARDEDGSPVEVSVNPAGTGVTTGAGLTQSTSVSASAKYFPSEHSAAGSGHKVAETSGFMRSDVGARWSNYKLREFSSGTPFGLDNSVKNPYATANDGYGNAERSNAQSGRRATGGGGNVKSLAELLGSKPQ